MVTPTISTFVENVLRSELLANSTLENTSEMSPSECAEDLIRRGYLTTFQAKQLLQNKYRGFFIDNKYKVLDFLGRGGMGRVLLCEHMILERIVAVKLMDPSLLQKKGAEDRFLREARASAKFDHPNLARVFDVDRSTAGLYLVMEYVDGINLQELVQNNGKLSPHRATEYIRQACLGLQQAHLAGMVHRDIKPSNLMIDRTGLVKVLDLGLARFFEAKENDQLTSAFNPNAVIGTADYIAPEQALDSINADIRADIYSLGCTLYFLLTQNLPAGQGTTMQKLLRHQSKEPAPVKTYCPEISDSLSNILARMMLKDPAARYQTPQEVVEALEPLITEQVPIPHESEFPPKRLIGYRLGIPMRKPDNSSIKDAPQKPRPAVETTSRKVKQDSRLSSVRESVSSTPTPSPNGTAETIPSLKPSAVTSQVLTSAISPSSSPGVSAISDSQISSKASTILSLPTESLHPVSGVLDIAASATSKTLKLTTQILSSEKPKTKYSVRKQTFIITGIIALGLILCSFALSFGWFIFYRPTRTIYINPVNSNNNSSGVDNNKPLSGNQQAMIVLRGGGSTFVKPIFEHWSELYSTNTGKKVEYTAAGSSKGIEGVLSGFLDFACSDAPLTDAQLKKASQPILHIPLVMGAVVPTYNVVNESGESLNLRFTGPVLAQIYLGKITSWNDPAIIANNPGMQLPNLDITVVSRSDGSGTTNIFTEYLCKSSSAWKSQVGQGNTVAWPVGIQAEKNNGVADMVSRTPGSIGYVEYSYALSNNLPIGAVKNRHGTYIMASSETITQSATGMLKEIPDDLRFSLTDSSGTHAYPIVGTSWAVLYEDQKDEKVQELVDFLTWVIHEGQDHVSSLHYGKLPATLVDKIQESIQKIH